MSKKLIETVYGKYSKYEIYRDSGVFGPTFKVYKDDEFDGSFDSLDKAVDYAKKKAK